MRTTHRCFAALQPSTVVCVCVCFSFSTCLFVWASDELIGAGADWLLLREGGNFSVILWLIIALKYVTVPTPSEVFLTGSFDVCFARGEAGRADKTSRPGNPLRGKQHTSALDRFVVQIVGKKQHRRKWRGKWQDSSARSCQERSRRRALPWWLKCGRTVSGERLAEKTKKYKIAKHGREISKSRDTNNLILWTHLRAYLQGSFPPDLHGEGKKKKKKKLNVLGDQTTSYSLCLEAARAA